MKHSKPKNQADQSHEELGYPPEDGERYTVGIQKSIEPKTFVDFAETDDLVKAKTLCTDTCCDEELETIVWDRKVGAIIFREIPAIQESEKNEQSQQPVKSKRGRKNQ
jgi:hypothetical protein